MKFKKFGFIVCACVAVSLLLSFTAFAEKTVFTQHKVELIYNKETSTVDADVYISNGTAIVGYCSFVFDSNVLCLIDEDGNAVTSGNVPDFASDGSIYLSKIVTAHNGIVVTDVAKGSSKLVNPDSGHVMFAWYLPSTIPSISANDTGDVLIASFRFKVVSDINEDEFDKDTFWVAGNEVTDKINGWYPGIVVLNDKQQQFNFDGSVEDGDLFVLEYHLNGLKKDTSSKPDNQEDKSDISDADNKEEDKSDTSDADNKDEDKSDTSDSDNKSDTSDADNKEEDKSDTSDADNKEEDKSDTSDADNKEEDKSDTSDTDNKEEDKSDTGKTENTASIVSNNLFKANFDISLTVSDTTIHLEWKAPSSIQNIENYTAVLCDNNYNIIRKVDIFRSSTSYTFKKIKDDFNYKLYFCADSSKGKYTSDVLDVKTDKAEEPEAIIYSVSYNAGKGNLYGISSELVLFSEKLTKVPKVIPPTGKYFIGWTFDGETLFDTENSPIFRDYKFSAVYADEPYNKPFGYITGYTDGTFKPEGSITRAEAAVLISRISPLFNQSSKYNHSFTDCDKGSWYENAVAFCNQNGFITGYTDGTFKPEGSITRAEFATILVRVYGFENVQSVNIFNDIENHWACPYICRLFGAGIVKPDKNGAFSPDKKLTRKDAVVMINACFDITPNRNDIDAYLLKNGIKFSDIPMYEEFFYDIMAATLKKEDYTK